MPLCGPGISVETSNGQTVQLIMLQNYNTLIILTFQLFSVAIPSHRKSQSVSEDYDRALSTIKFYFPNDNQVGPGMLIHDSMSQCVHVSRCNKMEEGMSCDAS